MDRPVRRIVLGLILLLAVSGRLAAQGDIPLNNWTVPPYTRDPGSAGGITTMTDISPGVGFTAMAPCRVVDTRGGGPFTGLYGPPSMFANAEREFDINSAAHCPGIPATAEAYSLNFTVTQTAGAPGDIRVWPKDNPPPPTQITSVLNWQAANTTIANAIIIPAGTGGYITVFVAGTATHLLIDINGYFTASQNFGQSFIASGSVSGTGVVFGLNLNSAPESSGVRGQNNSAGNQVYGLHGEISSATPGSASAAVRGENFGTNANGYGVWGSHAGGGWGIFGTSLNGRGVFGSSADGVGVLGSVSGPTSTGNVGVFGQAASTGAGSGGVVGNALADSGQVYGVRGASDSASLSSAGVFGSANEDDNSVIAGGLSPAGVRGQSALGYGVLGISENAGVAGVLVDAAGGILATGVIGFIGGADTGGAPPWSFFGNKDIGSPGNKSFVEPHPTDADKIIQYVALEGPEAGTYFRGRARFQNGLATIQVPEDFRMVTDPEGLTVQITPMGAMASVGVLRADLSEIVVQSSRNVEFSYLVQGVRRAFKDRTPIRRSGLFAPQRADSKIDETLAPDLKQRLVANGTYNPDGTANLDTAKRLGWDKVWEKQNPPAAPNPE